MMDGSSLTSTLRAIDDSMVDIQTNYEFEYSLMNNALAPKLDTIRSQMSETPEIPWAVVTVRRMSNT
jgi:hypothetical protein